MITTHIIFFSFLEGASPFLLLGLEIQTTIAGPEIQVPVDTVVDYTANVETVEHIQCTLIV